jgi:hypothetical protein
MSSNTGAVRRTLLTGAATATSLAGLPSSGHAEGPSPTGPFTIEGWQAAWRNPDPARVMARIPLIATPDIVGYWPWTAHPVRGPADYARRIVTLLTLIPDFRAELKEHAVNGDVLFLRWAARGTGPDGVFEAVGVDRMILRNGFVAENLILSDHPVFAAIALHVGDARTG